jgi:hypothetical protein
MMLKVAGHCKENWETNSLAGTLKGEFFKLPAGTQGWLGG